MLPLMGLHELRKQIVHCAIACTLQTKLLFGRRLEDCARETKRITANLDDAIRKSAELRFSVAKLLYCQL